MKAISLWQPWAQWIADGHKTIETRTHSRFSCLSGQRVAIHAAKRFDPDSERLAGPWLTPSARASMAWARMVSGAIVCTVNVDVCWWLDDPDSERAMIECGSGTRFGLLLSGVSKLLVPIACVGRQGIFEVGTP